jgi:hypothetical protein
MRRMLEEADRRKWLSKYKFELDQTLAVHNDKVGGDIFALAIREGVDFTGKIQDPHPWLSARGYLPDANRFCLAVSRPLFRANGRRFARLVLSRLWKGMSFYEGSIALLLGALPFLLGAEPMTMLLALFALCHLSHTFLVAVLTTMLGRYTFYTYNLMLLALLLLLQRALSMRSGAAQARTEAACP